MKKLTVYMLLSVFLFGFAACGGSGSGGNTGNNDAYQGPLTGTWDCIEQGVHGNARYLWSFGEDGRFAYLFTAYEPPHGGGDMKSSVRERFFQGRFSENDGVIKCYDVKYDDFFSWGDKWRYFPDRTPELHAEKLLKTKLKKPKNAGDFSLSFEFTGDSAVRFVLDLEDPFDRYDMEFGYIGN